MDTYVTHEASVEYGKLGDKCEVLHEAPEEEHFQPVDEDVPGRHSHIGEAVAELACHVMAPEWLGRTGQRGRSPRTAIPTVSSASSTSVFTTSSG